MRHQWVFSLVTCLHQVSYHTFYQWVTYDWWEPRLLFSFICDLSERTTGISRLLNSLNAWRQGLTVLIQAGSRVLLFTSGWWEEGQEKKGEGEKEGKGGGIPFVNSGNSHSAGFLSPRGCVWGKVHFRKLGKRTVRTSPLEAPRDSLGLAGAGTEFSLMTWAFVFQISSPDFIPASPDC